MPMEADVRSALAHIAWLPNWVLCLGIFGAAGLLAVILHAVAYNIFDRVTRKRGLFQRSLVKRTRGVALLGLLALLLEIAASIAPLTPQAAAISSHLLQVVFIAFLGWVAMQALHAGSVVYSRRFKLGSEDDLLARRHVTQIRILERIIGTLIILLVTSACLMTFPSVRQFGVSLLASAGVAGIVLGLALQPIFSNLMVGLQIAITQPIRINDAVVVEGENGRIEEIGSAYVVVRLWDRRRMIVPLKYFLEKPFQNWTRETSNLIGAVFLKVDYTVEVDALRGRLKGVVRETPLWDGEVCNLQVTDATENTIEIRIAVSARNAPDTWDLRCFVREKMIEFLKEQHPEALPRQRTLATNAAPNGAFVANTN